MLASRRGFGFLILATVTVVVVVVTLGCGKGKSQEQTAEKLMERTLTHSGGGDADVDLKGGKIRIRGEGGQSEVSIRENEWPSDLPGDVPEFKRARIKGVSRSEREGKKGWTVVLEDIPDGAYATYAGQLEDKGWTIMSSMTTDEGGMLQATRDEWMIFGMYNKAEATGTIGVSMQ